MGSPSSPALALPPGSFSLHAILSIARCAGSGKVPGSGSASFSPAAEEPAKNRSHNQPGAPGVVAKINRRNVAGQNVRVLAKNCAEQALGNRHGDGSEKKASNSAHNPWQQRNGRADALQLPRGLRRKERQPLRTNAKVREDRVRNRRVAQDPARNFL